MTDQPDGAHVRTQVTGAASVGARLDDERRKAGLLGDVREAIFGAQDGLVSTLAVVSTVSGATNDRFPVLIAGIAAARSRSRYKRRARRRRRPRDAAHGRRRRPYRLDRARGRARRAARRGCRGGASRTRALAAEREESLRTEKLLPAVQNAKHRPTTSILSEQKVDAAGRLPWRGEGRSYDASEEGVALDWF